MSTRPSSNEKPVSEQVEVAQDVSTDSTPGTPSGSPPYYGSEVKPRLTWQMALAFVVR